MSVRMSLRVVSLLLFQVILLTFAQFKLHDAASNSSSDLNDETVLNDLSTGKRQILTIGRMVYTMDKKIVMLVAELDDKGLVQWDDIYVYSNIEQVSKGMVFKGGEMLKTKWPVLHENLIHHENRNSSSIFTISDFKNDYVAIFMNDDKHVLYSINEGKLYDYNNFYGYYNAISSTELYASYATKGQNAKLILKEFDGHGDTLLKYIGIKDVYGIDICKADDSDELSINQDCKSGPMNWQIRTGFVDDKFAHLIDKQGTVYKFDAAALKNSSAKLETIKRNELFGSAKNGNDTKSNGAGGLGTGAIVVIVVVVIVIILTLVAVAGYCLCCSGKRSPKSKPKSSGSRVKSRKKSSKIKGSKIKGSKVSSAKKSSKIASRIRSKRRSSAKSGATSKASTGRSSALVSANKPASGRKKASSRASGRRTTKPASTRKVSSRR